MPGSVGVALDAGVAPFVGDESGVAVVGPVESAGVGLGRAVGIELEPVAGANMFGDAVNEGGKHALADVVAGSWEFPWYEGDVGVSAELVQVTAAKAVVEDDYLLLADAGQCLP